MKLVQYNSPNAKYAQCKKTQTGVVLFIALIALLVMSLAAVALIRSVDTNTVIAGNLSYKQTAVISSSFGLENATDTLGIANLDYSEATHAANGYYAVCTNFSAVNTTCNGENLTADASWVPGTTSRLADGVVTGITGGLDAYGNTVQYIVERMCSQVGVANAANCMLSSTLLDTNSHNVPPKAIITPADISLYRVTVRVAGPKNTLSYIQAFIS